MQNTQRLKRPVWSPTHTGPQSALRLTWTRQEDKRVYAQNGFKMTFGGACIAAWLPAGVRVGCCWFPRSTNKQISPVCAEILKSPQSDLLRLKWKSNKVRFVWNFKESCCHYSVAKFSKFNLYYLVRLNLSAKKSVRCIFWMKAMFNWWK